MVKRFAACLLAVSLLAGTLSVGATNETDVVQTENQQDAMTISIGDVVAEVDAENVSVPVEISNNVGIGALELYISYDEKIFTLTNEMVDFGEIFEESDYGVGVKNGVCTIVGIALSTMQNTKENGLVAMLNFKVKDSAPSGVYPIVISDKIIGSVEEEEFTESTVFEDGSIKITRSVEPVVSEDDVATDEETGDAVVEEVEEGVVPVFADTAGHWAVKYINEATEFGFFKGSDDGRFDPEGNITRAQFITVLWRMAGSPESDKETPFTDIETLSSEFKTAISWGFTNGYVNGVSDTEFNPNGILTREAGMKMLHYYSGGKVGTEAMFYKIYDGVLTDSSDISSWAKPSVYWGIYYMLISGTTDTTISPQAPMTRAQMAKIMVSYKKSEYLQK